jgi:Zn-dependent protease with chaperone function
MSDRRHVLVLGGLSVATLSCLSWILFCPHRADCLRAVTPIDTWVSGSSRVMVPLLIFSVGAWLLRLGWLLARTRWQVSRLPVLDGIPAALEASRVRTAASHLACLPTDAPIAFCAGVIRPRIVVSAGLVRRLSDDELDAVLLHERDHARRLEPLTRAACDAAAQVFFYVPLVRWWARRRMEDSELRADRAAFEQLGRRPVAAALWALGGSTSIVGAAAFRDMADLRVAQILGDPLPRRVPELSLIAISAMGFYLALQAVSCLGQGAQHLL